MQATKRLTEEEILFEKEGRGRFNLRRTSRKTAVPQQKRTRTGPQAVIDNNPVILGDLSEGFDKTKYTPKLSKDAMGNDVRVMVPFKRKRKK